jgi:hypothetical protein
MFHEVFFMESFFAILMVEIMKFRVTNIASSETNPTEISNHLWQFLVDLRMKRIPPLSRLLASSGLPLPDDYLTDEEFYDDLAIYVVTDAEGRKIRRRAEKLAKLRTAASSAVGHLKKEEIDRLRPFMRGVRMIYVENEHRADEITAELHEHAPWMAPATEYVWQSLRRSAARGEPVCIPPIILNGPAGIGKSTWARKLATILRAPCADLDASKGGAGYSLVGLERGWSTAQAGRPLETMIAANVGNPIMIVDEICKAKRSLNAEGNSYSFADSLLSLLEPATSTAWECPYYRIPFNMSQISWLMTANDVHQVSGTILSRCQVLELRDLTHQEIHDHLDREAKRMKLSRLATDIAHEVLDASPELLKRKMSLRDVGRLLNRADALEMRPTLH